MRITQFSWSWTTLFFILLIFVSCKKEELPEGPSCSDGILNQDEVRIDCGGVCKECPSCDDGIQNQGELGIDCSGPCPACDFLPPCSYADNTALLDHFYASISCDEANKQIIGEGEKGKITISFVEFPTNSVLLNLSSGNSLVIYDNPTQSDFIGVGGKMYVEFTGDKFSLTFCGVSFSSDAIGGFLGSGRILCE